MSRWWPATHSINASPLKQAIIEPRAGGRWYERREDGTECQWGKVLVWEPPTRLVLAWKIGAAWKYDPAFLTEVEVRFIAEGPAATRVELEHRGLESYGAAAAKLRGAFDSPGGWSGLWSAMAPLIRRLSVYGSGFHPLASRSFSTWRSGA
jgi:uncharacterized protein YndB with AHSA1/START domain